MSRKKEATWETEKEHFPSTMRDLMKKRKITQKELAEAIGTRPQTVSLYVTGQSAPDINCLKKIAEFFDVSSDYLLGLSDIPTNKPDIQAACVTTGLEADAVYFLQALKGGEGGALQCEKALTAINTLLSEKHYSENVEFWHRIFVYFANNGKSVRGLIEGEDKPREFAGEDILGVYLLENNRYLGELRKEWQQTHKKEDVKNGQHQKRD